MWKEQLDVDMEFAVLWACEKEASKRQFLMREFPHLIAHCTKVLRNWPSSVRGTCWPRSERSFSTWTLSQQGLFALRGHLTCQGMR